MNNGRDMIGMRVETLFPEDLEGFYEFFPAPVLRNGLPVIDASSDGRFLVLDANPDNCPGEYRIFTPVDDVRIVSFARRSVPKEWIAEGYPTPGWTGDV